MALSLLCWIIIVVKLYGLPLSPTAEPHSTIGRVMARKAVSLLGPKGRIMVITRDTDSFLQSSMDQLFHGFESELAKSKNSVESILKLQLDPLRPNQVPPGDLFELMRKANSDSVLVTFMGAPFLNTDQLTKLGPNHCKVIAFCPGGSNAQSGLKTTFQAGLLQDVIIERPQARSSSPSPTKTIRSYDALYAEYNGANLPTQSDGLYTR